MLNAVFPEASKPRGSPKYSPPSSSRMISRLAPRTRSGWNGVRFESGGVVDRRPKVRKSAERLAQREQRRFRAFRRQPSIELRMADGAQQHGIRSEACFERRLGQARAIRIDRHAANPMRRKRERLAGMLRDVLQNADRFFRNLRTDAVSRQQRNFQ